MTRILADLPDEDIKWLDETAAALGCSRASLIGEAVAFFRGSPGADKNREWLEAGSGCGKTERILATPSNGKDGSVHHRHGLGMMIMKR